MRGQQLVAAQQQLGEIHHAFALALLVVGRVELDEAARGTRRPAARRRARSPSSFAALMKYCTSRGGKAVVVDVVRALQPLDPRRAGPANRGSGRSAAGRRRGGARAACGCTGRGRCRSTCRARLTGSMRRKARQHLPRRLVGEGDRRARQPGVACAGLDQPRDARGQHARLAAARAGQDQRVTHAASVTAASCSGLRLARSGELTEREL